MHLAIAVMRALLILLHKGQSIKQNERNLCKREDRFWKERDTLVISSVMLHSISADFYKQPCIDLVERVFSYWLTTEG